MNTQSVINKLQTLYPGKTIIKNNEKNPTEIICEIEPTAEYRDYSIAIFVIDASIPHFHKKSTEVYEILNGEMEVTLDGKIYKLTRGQSITIKPNQHHFARGNETWARVTSRPGWTREDHYIMKSTT